MNKILTTSVFTPFFVCTLPPIREEAHFKILEFQLSLSSYKYKVKLPLFHEKKKIVFRDNFIIQQPSFTFLPPRHLTLLQDSNFQFSSIIMEICIFLFIVMNFSIFC